MSMERYEPINLESIISQELPKQVLKAILKRPSEAPRMIIMSGPKGTGRKSLIKNYIKSMYCSNDSLVNCGTCEVCNTILANRAIYREIDYSEIEDIEYSKYIVIKDFEKCSRELQVKLFNWWDSNEERPTIIMITENTDNIIENINITSLILRTNSISYNEIVKSLEEYNKLYNFNIEEETINTIARRARGSLLIAYKMIDNYSILENDLLKESIKSAREYYIAFLISCYDNNIENVEKFISRLKSIPLAYLKVDYESLILEILKVYTKRMKPEDKLIECLIQKCKTKVLDLYYIMNDKIIYNSFNNDDTFQSAMYVIYLKLINKLR